MTLLSRDQMPPSTPYEAELRERLTRMVQENTALLRLAAAQDHVVAAARAVVQYLDDQYLSQGDPGLLSLEKLQAALVALDTELSKLLMETRDTLTGPSVIEEALKK